MGRGLDEDWTCFEPHFFILFTEVTRTDHRACAVPDKSFFEPAGLGQGGGRLSEIFHSRQLKKLFKKPLSTPAHRKGEIIMLDTENRIAKDLLSIGAVFLRPDEPFTWASGIKSPIYCDNRLTLSAPSVRRGDRKRPG